MTENVNKTVKLNVWRTVAVGLAFFTVSMFWQVYDSIMPYFLLDFGLGATLRGLVMTIDNVLALVLLPFMGLLSDRFPMKLRSKFGRRIPFIVCGTTLASATFLLVNFAHNKRMLALMLVLAAFMLVFMSLYRTPAVALMPDITPKVIRSQANTVINVMGVIGGFVALIVMTFCITYETRIIGGESVEVIAGSNWVLIGLICGIMMLCVIIMAIKVKENKFVEDKIKYLQELNIVEDEEVDKKKKTGTLNLLRTLKRPQLKSLMFLLVSVFLWYMSYNAVSTHFSVFAQNELNVASFTLPLMVVQVAAFIMFFPATLIGKKIGRKNTVLLGVVLMLIGFSFSSVLVFVAPPNVVKVAMYPVFVLVGCGWATINVHSYVMSVEMADSENTGVFTGLYYTFSMAAQALSPTLAGLFMDYIDDKTLLVYCAVFILLALFTMIFVRHGNASNMPIVDKSIDNTIDDTTISSDDVTANETVIKNQIDDEIASGTDDSQA